MTRTLHRACAAALVLSFTARARAASRGIAVSSEGCGDLRGEEIERVLTIELADVARTTRPDEPLAVELTCDDGHVRAVAIDPVTSKRLSRDIDLGRAADRERTIALLVSQLFLTSWSELLLPPPPGAPPRPPPPPSAARAAEGLTRRALTLPSAGWELLAIGGIRIRDLRVPTIGERVALRPTLYLRGRWGIALELGYERGSAERVSGAVDYVVTSAAAGVSYRAIAGARVSVDAGARVGAAYVTAHGDPTAPASASAASGGVADLALGVTPSLRAGRFVIGVEAAAGLGFPRLDAHVARDRDVSLGGIWCGVSLVLGAGSEDAR